MVAALGLLAASIAPTRFQYVAREPLLFHYTEELILTEKAAKDQGQEDAIDALVFLKRELAHRFAVRQREWNRAARARIGHTTYAPADAEFHTAAGIR
jgi:hypothetical protein